MDISFEENEITNNESSSDKNDFLEDTMSTEIFSNKINNNCCLDFNSNSNNECNYSSFIQSQDNDIYEIPDLYSEVEFIISHLELMENNNLYNLNLDENEESNPKKNYSLKELEKALKNNNYKNNKKIKKEILKNKSLIKQIIREHKRKLNTNNDTQYNIMNIKRNRFWL